MRNRVCDGLVEDLLSIPPLVQRIIRRKLLRNTAEIEIDISPPLFHIMFIVGEEGSLHIAEIGERLQIPRPQMTHLIDRLVSLELVERRSDTTDRRTINITLTEKGRKMIEEHDQLFKTCIKENLSCLTAEELQELSVSLRSLGDILSKLP